MAEAKNDPLSIENLFRSAFERTKDRFWSYIFTMLLYIGLTIAAVIAIGLLVGLNALVYGATQSVPATATLAVISTVIAIVGFMYVGSWGTLAMAQVLVSKEKTGAMAAYKEVRPLVWRYVGFSLLTTLFIFGLIPISIPTLFILLLVWAIWSSVSLFVFLDKKEKGLMPLWRSKAMVSQRFWGVFVRLVLIYIAMWVIMGGLSYGMEENAVFSILYFVFSIVIGPFIMSYIYEIYQHLPEPKEVGSQKVWIVISIIGWILIALVAVTGAQNISNAINSNSMQDIMEKQMIQQNVDSI